MSPEVRTLDFYVEKALEYMSSAGPPSIELPESRNTLVTGSQNGFWTGVIMHRSAGKPFVPAMETEAQRTMKCFGYSRGIGDVTIVSATGSRNVVPLAGEALKNGIRVNAIVCRKNSELSRQFPGKINEIFIEAAEEPPTVNVASYGRMIQAVTREDPRKVLQAIRGSREPPGGYGQFNTFTILLPDGMREAAAMADWKFNEIFGRKSAGRGISGRAFYWSNFMHGGGINDNPKELYISIGTENPYFGPAERRHHISVPAGFGPLGFLAASQHVIGRIQAASADMGFRDGIGPYAERMKGWKWNSPVK